MGLVERVLATSGSDAPAQTVESPNFDADGYFRRDFAARDWHYAVDILRCHQHALMLREAPPWLSLSQISVGIKDRRASGCVMEAHREMALNMSSTARWQKELGAM